jgi:2-polyprenyl-3-methyl-5-hydroxy-6-metoxy-1,4-benzoquinol methylase
MEMESLPAEHFPEGKKSNERNDIKGNEETMPCRICGIEIPVFDSVLCGISSAYIYYSHPAAFEPYSIPIYYCETCAHMQIPYVANKDMYDDYCYLGFITNSFEAERKRQLEIMVNASSDRGLFVDIGCGGGNCLEIAREMFEDILGVEPSKAFGKVLADKGIPHITDYFSRELLGERRCDFFFSSQVFDHLENPLEILKDIYAICNDNAVGMIEVPNGQTNWMEKEFAYVTTEHVSYFSPLSLASLANKAGFSVEYCNCYDGKNLEVLLRKRIPKRSFTEEIGKMVMTLEGLPQDKNVSFWGIGLKMIAILPFIEKHARIYRLYDSDHEKHGRYVPGCKTMISDPSDGNVNDNDVIVLVSTKYDNEIQDALRNRFGYTGEIRII